MVLKMLLRRTSQPQECTGQKASSTIVFCCINLENNKIKLFKNSWKAYKVPSVAVLGRILLLLHGSRFCGTSSSTTISPFLLPGKVVRKLDHSTHLPPSFRLKPSGNLSLPCGCPIQSVYHRFDSKPNSIQCKM